MRPGWCGNATAEEVVELFRSGTGIEELMDLTGATESAIRGHLYRAGYTKGGGWGEPRAPRTEPQGRSATDRVEMLRQMEAGRAVREIAEDAGINFSTVYNYWREAFPEVPPPNSQVRTVACDVCGGVQVAKRGSQSRTGTCGRQKCPEPQGGWQTPYDVQERVVVRVKTKLPAGVDEDAPRFLAALAAAISHNDPDGLGPMVTDAEMLADDVRPGEINIWLQERTRLLADQRRQRLRREALAMLSTEQREALGLLDAEE